MLAIILYLVVSYVNVTPLLKRIKYLPTISKWNMTKNFVRTALILIAGSSGLILTGVTQIYRVIEPWVV